MDTPDKETIDKAIKLFGEVVLPGASLLMDGKVVSGGLHVIAGAVAKAVVGPIGTAVVIANSYSESTTGTNLLKHVSALAQNVQSTAVPAAKAAAQAAAQAVSDASKGASSEASTPEAEPPENAPEP